MKKIVFSLMLMVLTLSLVGCNKEEKNKRVTLKVNPEIEFIVDDKNNITSVTGLNNEGKIILVDENIVGKSLEEGIDIVLKLEHDLGYLINVDGSLKIEFSCDFEKLDNKIKDYINQSIEKLDVKATIEEIKALTKQEIEEIVKEFDNTIDTAKLSYEELLVKLNEFRNETKELVTVELVELYNLFKNTNIEFKDKELTKNIIDNLDEKYQQYYNNFDLIFNTLNETKEKLLNKQYEMFVSEESAYQQAYKKVLEYKTEILSLQKEIEELDDTNFLKPIKQAELTAKKNLYDVSINTLDLAKQNADVLFLQAKNLLDETINSLDEFVNSLPTEIKTILTNNVANLETEVNNFKDNCFTNFENIYGSLIESNYNQVIEYKNNLK